MKNRIPARISLLGVAIFLSLFSSTAVQAQTRIRLATLLPQGTSQYHLLEAMGQQWRTGTNGALSLTIYAGGTMGSEKEMISRMRFLCFAFCCISHVAARDCLYI